MVIGAGCGGDDDSDDDAGGGDAKPYVEALADQMTESESAMAMDKTTATCLATEVVDAIGVSNLEDADVSPKDLAEADSLGDLDVDIPDGAAKKVADGLGDCEAIDQLKDAIIGGFAGDTGALPEEATQCLEDNVADSALAEATGALLIDGEQDQLVSVTREAVNSCPDAAAEILLQGLGGDLTAEDEACVRDFVEDNTQSVVDVLVGGDDASSDALGTQLGAACPNAFAAVSPG
jgi:hypothetical protein